MIGKILKWSNQALREQPRQTDPITRFFITEYLPKDKIIAAIRYKGLEILELDHAFTYKKVLYTTTNEIKPEGWWMSRRVMKAYGYSDVMELIRKYEILVR